LSKRVDWTYHPRCTVSKNWPKDNTVQVELTARGNLAFNENVAKVAAIVELIWRTNIPARTNAELWASENARWRAKLINVRTLAPGKHLATFQMTSTRPERTR